MTGKWETIGKYITCIIIASYNHRVTIPVLGSRDIGLTQPSNCLVGKTSKNILMKYVLEILTGNHQKTPSKISNLDELFKYTWNCDSKFMSQ